jgi:Mrp family chromosome partitioning ATPase
VIDVLLAVPGLLQEPELVVAAPAHGMVVRRRCVDAVELLAAAAADPAAVVVVSSALPRISVDAVDRLSAGSRRVAGLAADAEDAGRLRSLGIDDVIVAGSTAEATLQQLAAAWAADGETASMPPGVWSTGFWVEGTPAVSAPPSGTLLAVWGPMGSPGRTTVAIGLAEALAESGRRVCLVDADTYAPSVAMALGIVEEASGLVVACRHADNRSLTAVSLGTVLREVRPGWTVLGGLARPDRWPDLRAGALDQVWSACRGAFDVTVVDVGFCLEADEAAGPWSRRRNAAALTALAAADGVVAVADGSAAGAARLAVAWRDLEARAAGAHVTLVRNRADGGDRRWTEAVRSAGVPARVHPLPSDARALASCWARGRSLGEGARRSRIRRALRQLSDEALAG